MKPKLYTLLTLSVFTLLACKSPEKLYQQGDYAEAVERTVKKLQKDPDNAQLLDLLRRSYGEAAETHQSRIRSHSGSESELRWEKIHAEYMSLQRLYEEISQSPAAAGAIRPTDYSSFVNTYSDRAVKVRIDRGVAEMQKQTRASFRNAYHEFQAAVQLQPGNAEAREKMHEAYEHAVTKVLVLPLETYYGSGFANSRYGGYDYRMRNLESDLLRQLQHQAGGEFVRFYSEWDAESRNFRPDEIVDLRFVDFFAGPYHDRQSTRRVSKDILVREIVHRPDSIVKVYEKVYADVITTTRTMRSEGVMMLTIRDAEGRWLGSREFRGGHDWSVQFARYSGDSRALSEHDRQLLNQQQSYRPQEDDVMRYILNDITRDLTWYLRNHYNRF
ncbi:MAG TPA: hypothetical protein VEB63_01145 [Chitinophagaceae bacterium]|nr:hypothetical protein [Chitinophagaceae bacterium]